MRLANRVGLMALCLALPLLLRATYSRDEPLLRIPSNVAWTEETISTVNSGQPLRGLILARRCEHCHGQEGFSSDAAVPNLAGMDRLSFWKQLEDFRTGKRSSLLMASVAQLLATRDEADLAAYYSMLPTSPDSLDVRSFPQKAEPATFGSAARLVTLGDGNRGIPPCQACHGPVAFVRGAPSLASQNRDYIKSQLDAFAGSTRANDINMPMRAIARDLTQQERDAISAYYGAGLGTLPSTGIPVLRLR